MNNLMTAEIPNKANRMIRKHWARISVEIYAVDCGLKPAWLNDFLSVNVREFVELLDWMHCNGYIKNKLQAIQISSDVLVVKRNEFPKRIGNALKCLKNYNKMCSTPVFIFAGATQPLEMNQTNETTINRCVDKLNGIIADLKSYLENLTKEQYFDIDPKEFTPTVFGIALGYPVIYIQPATDSPQTLDLNVTTFTFNFTVQEQDNMSNFVCYSFSYPSSMELSDTQMKFIEQWKCDVINTCVVHGIDYNLELSTKQNIHVIL